MASENRRGVLSRLRQRTLDAFVRLYPYLAVFAIALAAAVMLAIGNIELALSGIETLGIPVLLAVAVLLGRRWFGSESGTVVPGDAGASLFGATGGSVSRGTGESVSRARSGSIFVRALNRERIAVSGFLSLFAISVLLLATSAYRPVAYFVVVALVYGLVLSQVLVGEFTPRILLAEISVLMLNLIYGVTLKYHYYYGWTDVFRHVERAKLTYLLGETIPRSIDFLYARFPLYHIFVSEASYVLDMDIKAALFVVTAIPYVTTAILLYYLLEGNFRDERIPAVATLVYSANSVVLFYGMYMITRTMAFVGFVFLLYLVYQRSLEKDVAFNVLIVLMTIFTTLVHQVSMPMIVVLLTGLYVCKRFAGSTEFLDLETLLLVGFGFVSYWLFNAWEFLSTILVLYLDPSAYAGAGGGTPSAGGESMAFVPRVRYTLYYYLIIFYAILGIGIGLYEEYSKYVHTLLLFALLTIGIFVPSPLRILGSVVSVLRFDRFALLVSPFVAVAMGTGIVWFVRQMNRNAAVQWLGTALAVVLVVTYVFASITSPLVASDAEGLPWAESRDHLTKQEVKGFDFVLKRIDSDSPLWSTAHATKFFNRQAFDDYDRRFRPVYGATAIGNVSNISDYEGYTVFRQNRFQESGLKLWFTGARISPTPETQRTLNRQFRRKAKIFSNGGIEIYYTNETAGG